MKKAIGWIFVALCMAAIANATVIKEDMTYEGVVTFLGGFVNTGTVTQTGAVGITGTLTQTGAVGITGTLTQTGDIIMDGSLVPESYEIGSETTYTHSLDNGNILEVDKTVGLASLTVTLPTITEAMDGYTLIVKQVDSGTTACTLTPTAGVDAIESTRGTLTGTSDATTDAQGDAKAFYADYNSGVSSVWTQLWVNQS